MYVNYSFVLCFVDHVSRYNRVKKNRFDVKLNLGIFLQPLHVSGLSMSIVLVGLFPIQPGQQTFTKYKGHLESKERFAIKNIY
jgi:hypothetical protein